MIVIPRSLPLTTLALAVVPASISKAAPIKSIEESQLKIENRRLIMIIMDQPLLPHALGFLAVISYIVTLVPTIIRIVFPYLKSTAIAQILLKQRRQIGILAFALASGHAFLLIQQRNIDWLDLKTFWIYFQGLTTFAIFLILTLTSNDWSVKKLKKNWKKLHKLTYLSMFLLTWHIWDKMSGKWTYLTPAVIIALTIIIVLFLIKLGIEFQQKQQKIQKKADKNNSLLNSAK
ncbi:MAG TPA: ferric reductase-like transmembrane domain-containing protein [Allocoleopsis sp.]